MKSTSERLDVYQIITERVCSILETGTVPWQKPWKAAAGQLPSNFRSKKAYRGINVFLLLCAPFECPYWVSYKQCTELGGQVRKGSKGFPVVFWMAGMKLKDGKPVIGANGKPEKTYLLRYYTVFNLEQTEGIKWEKPAAQEVTPFEAIESAERIAANMPNAPLVKHSGARACYSPSLDAVNMPAKETFDNPAGYYATLFHELTHSTGHVSRLARKGVESGNISFGSELYSKEELCAEMGSSFLCGHAGILHQTLGNSAAYCASWLKVLKGDSKLIVSAAAQAQKASDYILGVKFGEEAETPKEETVNV